MMHARLVLPAAAALLLLLPGCAQPPAGDGGAGPQQGEPAEPAMPGSLAAPMAWGLDGCSYVSWFVPADRQALQAELPPGFTAEPLGLVPGDDRPFLGVMAMQCSSADGAAPGEVGVGALYTGVTVDGYDGPMGGQYYKFQTLVTDEALRAALAAQGVPSSAGMTTAAPEAVSGTWQGMAHFDDVGHFGIQGASFPAFGATLQSAPFREFTAADGGLAVWSATIESDAVVSGWGTWSADPGSLMERVTGQTTGAAEFNAGQWSIRDGLIAVRPWP